MSKVVTKVIGILALSASLGSVALAGPTIRATNGVGMTSSVASDPVTSAPEIDPASALSGLTLLLGGLAVVRGRRAK